jgi:chromosome segregation ATPase
LAIFYLFFFIYTHNTTYEHHQFTNSSFSPFGFLTLIVSLAVQEGKKAFRNSMVRLTEAERRASHYAVAVAGEDAGRGAVVEENDGERETQLRGTGALRSSTADGFAAQVQAERRASAAEATKERLEKELAALQRALPVVGTGADMTSSSSSSNREDLDIIESQLMEAEHANRQLKKSVAQLELQIARLSEKNKAADTAGVESLAEIEAYSQSQRLAEELKSARDAGQRLLQKNGALISALEAAEARVASAQTAEKEAVLRAQVAEEKGAQAAQQAHQNQAQQTQMNHQGTHSHLSLARQGSQTDSQLMRSASGQASGHLSKTPSQAEMSVTELSRQLMETKEKLENTRQAGRRLVQRCNQAEQEATRAVEKVCLSVCLSLLRIFIYLD